MTYELVGTFITGVLSGFGIAYTYWRAIPIAKKKAAFAKLRVGMEDGKLTISEGMAAAEELL